jgi:hypothetical protein
MGQVLKSIVWVTSAFFLPIVVAGIAYAMSRQQGLPQSPNAVALRADQSQAAPLCQTLIADPSPPVNIRSSPVVAPDNALGQLPNATEVKVEDEDQGWLKISYPLQGWIYKELTITHCPSAMEVAAKPNQPTEHGARLLAIATQQYQSGNMNGSVALAKAIPADSPAHSTARAVVIQWQQDWKRAESDYYSAQKALRDGRWQDVMGYVNEFPDNRYWKERLAALVKQAVQKSAAKPAQ